MKRFIKCFILLCILTASIWGVSQTFNYVKKDFSQQIKDEAKEEDKYIPEEFVKVETSNEDKNSKEEKKTTNNKKLTKKHLIIFGVLSLVISLDLTYLLMSGFCKYKAIKGFLRFLLYIIFNMALTSGLIYSINYIWNKFYVKDNIATKVKYSTSGDLHINVANWSYDEINNIYYQFGIIYAEDAVVEEYQSMGIYVPGDYMSCKKIDTNYKCKLDEEKIVNSYNSRTAPIVMPINSTDYSNVKSPTKYSYNKISNFMKQGFIYVEAGARGKDNADTYTGGAPWTVVDYKAAIRYLRFNDTDIAGDKDKIFVFGNQSGGAIAAILGTSGDSPLYENYLKDIGALMKDDENHVISDAIDGVMAWNPITNLDTANSAYEWNMGQYATDGTRKDGTFTRLLSYDLASSYGQYINDIVLKDDIGTALTLSPSNNGVFIQGTYYDYIKSVIEESLTNYLTDTYESSKEMKKYLSKYSWVTFDDVEKNVTITSIEDFVKNIRPATKEVGAFDNFDKNQTENYLFGNGKYNNLHFDKTMSDLLNNNDYKSTSGYDPSYAKEYKSDIAKKDAFKNNSLVRQNMYNPMYYINDYYDGFRTSEVAKNWRIRSGITSSEDALVSEINLSLALDRYSNLNVDYDVVWNKGNEKAERTGDPIENFINFIKENTY